MTREEIRREVAYHDLKTLMRRHAEELGGEQINPWALREDLRMSSIHLGFGFPRAVDAETFLFDLPMFGGASGVLSDELRNVVWIREV